jgi:hypothetical protein
MKLINRIARQKTLVEKLHRVLAEQEQMLEQMVRERDDCQHVFDHRSNMVAVCSECGINELEHAVQQRYPARPPLTTLPTVDDITLQVVQQLIKAS